MGCPDSPTGLLTSFGSSGSDMLLSYTEVAQLRLDANLVILSACETAERQTGLNARITGETAAGATLEGLVRSFFAANARAVLATYWTTSNQGESEQFMQAFYESGKTNTITKALHDAQVAMIENPESSHPYFWAPFFVVGKTDANMLAGPGASVPAP